ncbi:putative membrane protein [Deinobacterium chartae]|uniref:Putative membrane protein n=1 Tax=Deinobacterium chartae TaxID=521158 RepID=A0A841I302_9DEIO|nr:DUF2270 domain-containing protein [Deinobacterium chartae]MBB6098790.1 putative membrane protein [Deinobacterium chartae]
MTAPVQNKTEFSYSVNSANSLIHLYRAEVGRMTAYRARLDTTTNWAVVTTAGLASFALGNENVTHTVFVFAMFLNYFFLHLEARRFTTYEISHHRVRIIERFFYPAMLGDQVDGSWHQLLLAELAKPRSPIDRSEALGWRLRRNYLWIYTAVLIAWLTKIDASRIPNLAYTVPEYVALARIANIPGWIVVSAVVVFYGILIRLAVHANRHYPLEAD